jgi:hypothetical protein
MFLLLGSIGMSSAKSYIFFWFSGPNVFFERVLLYKKEKILPKRENIIFCT